ncbi:hypothetical protein ACFW1A_13840 [Kitasatospora sp. NPDC058965]|uniref:hypothetical protein n=1 Tax=Kitasatospora sp. NPDC058965 TaxID=3346682 RepID=UPI0036916A23
MSVGFAVVLVVWARAAWSRWSRGSAVAFGEATAPTVPFLVELAGAPYVACKAEVLELLGSICEADQWHSAAAAAGGGEHSTAYRRQPGWESAARAAVLAGRAVIEGVASSVRPEEATAAAKVLQVMDHVAPFPEL